MAGLRFGDSKPAPGAATHPLIRAIANGLPCATPCSLGGISPGAYLSIWRPFDASG
jgi:hypothetical protein